MSPYRTGNFITAADELLKVIYLLKRYDFNALLNSFSPIDLVGGSPIVHVFMIKSRPTSPQNFDRDTRTFHKV